MAFYGLFVGIDSYEPDFTRLRFARRDAAVLAALFSDNLEGKVTLLLDGDATKARFVTEMRHLAEVATDEDFVVITFSGHGVPGGALATSGILPGDSGEGSLSLTEFVHLAREVRARSLLLVLDCCFSGHAADKVLNIPQVDCASRNGSVSVARKLDELQKDGRVVIAASGQEQEAFEDPSVRHGLLSHYLIQGLLGHADAVDDGKVYILKLAHYVSKNVRSHGRYLLKKSQDPVLSGSVSNFALKIFTRGPRYLATADAVRPKPATADLASLEPYEIPSSVLNVWRRRIGKLNQLQVDAVNEGALLEGMNVLVSAPTSTGKTMIGELGALRAVVQGKKAVFLLPTRALVNDQYEKFRSDYGPLGIEVIRATGELRDHMPKLINGDFQIAVLTYEKFVGLVLRNPNRLNAGVLVVDEIQSLALPDRGLLLETLLTWLRVRGRFTETPQVVGVSAVLGNPQELARWLGANLVTGARRGVPLLEGVVCPDGLLRHRSPQGRESTEQLLETEGAAGFDGIGPVDDDRLATRLVSKLVAEGQQVIVFRSTRSRVRKLARQLASALGMPPADTLLAALSKGDGGRTTDLLHTCLKHGVGFHIADLTADERHLLESSFGSPGSEVRVLVATTTLAQGVNLPADAVVLGDLDHPSADGRPYSVSEYKNMAGRAGRTGQAKQGRAFILARGSADADQKWRRYVQGEPEPVRSVLLDPATDIRAAILAGLSQPAVLARRRSGQDVERFLAATFAAHQSRARGATHPFPGSEVRRMVDELVDGGFLHGTPGGPETLPHGLALTDLGELTVRSGLGVDSVTAVAESLKSVPEGGINRATLICAAQLTSELEDVRFHRLPREPHREHARLAGALRSRGAADEMVFRLMGAPSRSAVHIGRARRSIACLMWAEGIRLAVIERTIGDRAQATRRDAPGPVQHAVQRATDVIRTVIEIAYHVQPSADLGSLPDVLPHQLELGIVAGLVPLAWHAQVPLPRLVYIGLAREGMVSPADVLAADPRLLLDCVDGDSELRRVVREAAAASCGGTGEGGPGVPATPPGH